MELVGTLHTYLAGSPGQVTSTAGTYSAPTSGAIGSGGQIDYQKLMEYGSSFASAAQSVFGANAQAGYIKSQAETQANAFLLESNQSVLDAKQAQLEGQQKSNLILTNLVQTLATQRLNFSANGMDPTFGTPVAVAAASSKNADLQLSTSRADAQALALSRYSQATAYQAKAAATLSAGKQGAQETIDKGLTAAEDKLNQINARRLNRG